MDTIRNVLEAIRQSANDYLQNIDRRDGEWIILTNIISQDGSLNESSQNKVIMNIYNITNETTICTYKATQYGENGYYNVSPPLYIDLHLVFMANFSEKQYPTGLAAISRLISYFQQNPWFTHATTPKLDPVVDKINLEFTNLSPVDVNYIMGMLGTKYLPSVFYKLRMIPFTSSAMQSQVYPARGGDISESPSGSGAAG